MAIDVVVSHHSVESAPVHAVAALFVVSVVGVALALLVGGPVQWMASIIAMTAPVEAEHALWRWRRLGRHQDHAGSQSSQAASPSEGGSPWSS
jgi:hypothetical protein